MSTLLEAILQVHLLLPPFGVVKALLRRLSHIRQDVSVHDTHVVNTVSPLLTEVTEQKGDLLIRDLWQQGTNSVHNMRVVNTDILSYVKKTPEKRLHKDERGKNKMYLEDCLQQRRHFSPFFALVDGLLGVEATATLKRVASRLATKWRQPYSKTCGYVKIRFVITLVRATHRCLRRSRVPAHRISVQQPQWGDGVGLKLFR